ncbi:MAG: hypothetical protein D6726_09505, partial [Nitrospirae bacterium]
MGLEKDKIIKKLQVFLLILVTLSIAFYGCGKKTVETQVPAKKKEKAKAKSSSREVSAKKPGGTPLETRSPKIFNALQGGSDVAIIPPKPSSNSRLSVIFKHKVSDAKYQWFVNGAPVEEANGPVLSHDLFKKGDEVYVRVTTDKGELVSQPVTISNSPPSIKQALLLPEFPTVTSSLNLSIKTEDPDGDPVTLRYEWYVNGEIQ